MNNRYENKYLLVLLNVVHPTHTTTYSSIMNVVPVLISLGDAVRRTDVLATSHFKVAHEMTVIHHAAANELPQLC